MESDLKLKVFMYLLIRDKLPIGEINYLVNEASRVKNEFYFSDQNIKWCAEFIIKDLME